MALVAVLDPGNTFGEEALLQDGLRNATVRMSTEGRLLLLAKKDFDRLLKAHLLHEVDVNEVERRIERKAADLIDCRYEAEYELWRIPGSRLMPLDTLRERARGLNPDREYLVYCRSGRRSRAAAFLLRQMGLRASSMKGGIAAWPFEIEGAATGS
jgi:rhodanese-related sulfurtransferase